jgi:hypothetical protein
MLQKLARGAGLEPATSRLVGGYSVHLSYPRALFPPSKFRRRASVGTNLVPTLTLPNMSPGGGFVNSDPTRYCAFHLGQSQDVDECGHLWKSCSPTARSGSGREPSNTSAGCRSVGLTVRPRLELFSRLAHALLVDDAVAPIHLLGLVANHRHPDRAGHGRALQIASSSPTPIMVLLLRIPGGVSRGLPRFSPM